MFWLQGGRHSAGYMLFQIDNDGLERGRPDDDIPFRLMRQKLIDTLNKKRDYFFVCEIRDLTAPEQPRNC